MASIQPMPSSKRCYNAAVQRDQDVIDRWRGVAPFREKHRETIRQMFAPVTQALIDDARLKTRRRRQGRRFR